MRVIGVIPARYQSIRFPGKPLADINGKPMIWWTYQRALQVKGLSGVYVATDDERIADACKAFNMNSIMTSQFHKCGTERVAEVGEKIFADYYLNIQGDEPVIEPQNLQKLIDFQIENQEYEACTLRKLIDNPVDAVNTTVSKVVCNAKSEVIYISRQAIPFPKASLDYEYYCAMGVYIFSRKALEVYRTAPKEGCEEAEDIELLRLVNNGVKIYAMPVDSKSPSVDTPKDLERIKAMLRKGGN